MTGAFRAIAVAIAVLAFVDPALVMTARGRARVALVESYGAADSAPRAAGADVTRRLESDLRRDFEAVRGWDVSAAATVVAGTEYPTRTSRDERRIYTVSLTPPADRPNVRIVAVRAPRMVPAATLVHLDVDVEATGAAGETSVIARVGRTHAAVATAAHTWAAGETRWRAALDVTPLDAPPWRIHVEASAIAGEATTADNAAEVLVDLAKPLRVLVYEPRPSWATAFTRRALEGDPRFEVAGLARPGRGTAVTSGEPPPLRADRLEDVQAIVVGGLDRLSDAEAELLRRFLRDREGVVVLQPDSRADAVRASSLFGVPSPAERLLEKPVRLATESPLPPLVASELLVFEPGAGGASLARTTGTPADVIVTQPAGGGRLILSGALDAWRYRAQDQGAFDRFWQAAIAGAAMAAPPAIDVDVAPAIVVPDAEADVFVRVRRSALGIPAGEPLTVSAALDNGDPIRLWPDAAVDSFRGSVTAPEGSHFVAVAVAAAPPQRPAVARFIVSPDAQPSWRSSAPLALLSGSHGGIDVTPAALSTLERRLRDDLSAPAIRVERRPMRSPWWMLPFAICLSADWWIRRRRGLR